MSGVQGTAVRFCILCTIFITLRYCHAAAHATSQRVALHRPASGTLLLYKQLRSRNVI